MKLLVSIDEAAERLKALEAADSSNAFEMGDIVLAAVPMVETERDESTEGRAFAGAAGLFKDQGVTEALKELGEKAGMSWSTLKERRTVSSRIPVAARAATGAWRAFRVIAYAEPGQRPELLALVQHPNPDREDGRWTETAIRTHLPKKPGTGSAPLRDEDPNEQALGQMCRGLDQLLMANDTERLERFRAYWRRQVPERLQALAWWEAKQQALADRRAARKAKTEAS